MAIIQQDFADFKTWLNKRLAKTRTPFSGTFELTPQCNFFCTHCYLQEHKSEKAPLSTKKIMEILDQLKDSGALSISFTGGEPLLREDYKEIHKYAFKLGFWINIFTNGSLIDRKMADFLEQYPPRGVEISLYGGDEDTYQKITGRKNQFDIVINAIDQLLSRKIKVVLKSVLLTPILKSIHKMEILAKQRELKIAYDPSVTPTVENSSNPVMLRVDPSKAVEIEFSPLGAADKLREYNTMVKESDMDGDTPLCGAGFNGYHIDYKGNLMPCVMLRAPSYSLIDHSFKDAFALLGNHGRPMFDEESECRECELRHLCSFCPGSIFCNESYPSNRNSFYCFIAAKRMAIIKSGQ
ncbi:MAG: radical SAM protein [Deltaproteobacteria bacterium]|nr:radical SAM protein [Deltaproteobacteria bacterium]